MELGLDNDIMGWFDEVSENAGWVQTKTLRMILEANFGVEYLWKWFGDINIHGMDSSALEALYTSLVPLASHADFEPFIQRIVDGDTSPILTQQPITTLSLRYYLPSFHSSFQFLVSFWNSPCKKIKLLYLYK